MKQFGINPDTMTAEKLQKIMEIADKIKDHSEINQETIIKLRDTLGINIPDNSSPKEKIKKVPRNSKCPCDSGLKWKKCCGKLLS